MQQAKLKALGLRDDSFDKAYIDEIGVSAHEDAVKLFEKASNDVKDPDIKHWPYRPCRSCSSICRWRKACNNAPTRRKRSEGPPHGRDHGEGLTRKLQACREQRIGCGTRIWIVRNYFAQMIATPAVDRSFHDWPEVLANYAECLATLEPKPNARRWKG